MRAVRTRSRYERVPAKDDDHRARAVIAQRDVDQKTNEITQVRPLLDDVDITGPFLPPMRCTCRNRPPDTSWKTRRLITFTAVKDNQPGLFAALDVLDWENTSVTRSARDRGHGRERE
jgi:hypothetical protein